MHAPSKRPTSQPQNSKPRNSNSSLPTVSPRNSASHQSSTNEPPQSCPVITLSENINTATLPTIKPRRSILRKTQSEIVLPMFTRTTPRNSTSSRITFQWGSKEEPNLDLGDLQLINEKRAIDKLINHAGENEI